MSFVCPRCRHESFHPNDETNGYCGRCHWWTGDLILGAPDVIAAAEADGAISPIV